MSKPTKTDATIAELEAHADAIRAELKVPKQADMFRFATEAGYLTALADGTVEDAEIGALVRAVEILSEGAVIEWETDALVADCQERARTEGADKRATAVGQGLSALGQAEAGILVAAIVARATKKIGKKEADVLKAVGKAAGLSSDDVAAIVKRATSLGGA
jgi:hypothetical protein